MTVNFTKGKFNLREKLKELERPSVDKLVTKDENGAYIDTIRGTTKLESIDSVISDTAVDIFIYDTSKDSDGGAWRHRTSHTSWYNEELNTTTRGSRREFPAVAVIVVTGTQMIIYDGDDPDLPMWMIFTRSSGSGNFFDATHPQNISAKNAILYPAGTGGSILINFISEYNAFRNITRQYNKGNIAERNSGKGWVYISGASDVLLNNGINDVAMTVLPNAPIDSATGLPIPTIAVATDGGISIIKDDGTVISATTFGYPTRRIDIKSSGELFHQQGSGSNEGICFNYPFTRISGLGLETYANSSTFWYASDGVGNASNYLGYSSVTPTALSVSSKSSLEIGDNRGLTFVSVNAGADVASHSSSSTYSLNNGMVAYATTSYNTGWMHGDIKGAFLSDTDATNVSADTLNSVNTFDGTFATSTGWTVQSDWTISGGVATCNGAGSGPFIFPFPEDSWTIGSSVVVEVTVTAYTSGTLFVSYGSGSATAGTNMTATGTYKFVGTVSANTIVYFGSTSFVGSIDNVKIYYAEEDRSVNNKGLAVYGTITKSAVATGAELVAYSGWSTSNYLEQPPNTDMNVGTGDFYVMGWIKPTSSTTGYVWEYGAPGDINGYTEMYITSSGILRFHINGGTQAEKSVVQNVWQHFVCVRRGGQSYVYVNGDPSSAIGNSSSLSNSNAKLRIGIRAYNISTPFYGQLALVRMGASAPSAEQIKKIYEDEKFLFQENATCTLYGSSDAVTALAYDEVTERLHVGTSSGRSEFQGLRRINNTTTAVTTAISAYDSFVVEQ